MIDRKTIERAVMQDNARPCLFNVAGPCFHSKCLDAHFKTIEGWTKHKERERDIPHRADCDCGSRACNIGLAARRERCAAVGRGGLS